MPIIMKIFNLIFEENNYKIRYPLVNTNNFLEVLSLIRIVCTFLFYFYLGNFDILKQTFKCCYVWPFKCDVQG